MITTFDAQMNPTRLLVQEWDYDKWKFLGDTQYLLTYNPDNVLTEGITKIRMVDGGPLENLSRDVYRDFQTFNITGAAEQLPESSLAVFPNPTSGNLNISLTGAGFKQAQIQLFNLQGKKMYEAMASFRSISTGNHVIPCQQLGAGVYVLRITTDNNKGISRRVVKMK
ncbi:T9SS type A sorting domain-containing protein [Rufibacter hautae]|uniref:T9SS type A sorting domain-containing protein n=1 Tax=Rufibacter hautae TaxID=2595005 RepID=A0A5B6TMA6_9BACT|nr:T9SS type A sorting domain-containing protein [Rufibacter hautae]KAA3440535.1 T9SS type A sorting domain-containing protein [Rufibacter hautae]